MSIEKNLDRIATALEAIVELESRGRVSFEPAPAEPLPIPVPMNPNPFVTPEEQFPAAPAAPAPAPAVPAAPAVPSGPAAPFTDHKGLSAYVMGKYRTLGPVKGALIQNVLSEIGCKNINEVKPEMYGTFFQKVEAI